MKITQSNSKAFSTLELVFAITLLGVLITLAFSRGVLVNQKKCNSYLSLSLQNFQNEISLLFTQNYFLHQSSNFSHIQEIFQKHTQKNNSNCSLNLHQNFTITAINKNLKTTFYITPNDFSTNIKIQCNFGDLLCRKINFRDSIQ